MSFLKVGVRDDLKRLLLCDIIYLRGVLFYMMDENREATLKNISKRLAPDGCLLVGRGETRISGRDYRYFQNDFGSSAFFKRPPDSSVVVQGPPPAAAIQKTQKRPVYRVKELKAELTALTDALRAMALLKSKNIGEVESLVNSLPIRKYKPGEALLNEAEPNDVLMGIVAGEVSIWLGTGMFGRPTRITTLGSGHFVGEQSVFERVDCNATVRAETPVTVFEIDRHLFRQLMDENTYFATYIRNLMRSRLAQRSAFRQTGALPKQPTVELRKDSKSLGLNDEKRYVLEASALAKGAKVINFDDALAKDFMAFVRRASLLRGLSIDVLDTFGPLDLLCGVSRGYIDHTGESVASGFLFDPRGRGFNFGGRWLLLTGSRNCGTRNGRCGR